MAGTKKLARHPKLLFLTSRTFLKMRMQLGTLIVWCIFFFLVAKRVFAGSGLFLEEATTNEPAYAETLTAETKHSQLDSTAFFDGSLGVWEETRNQAAVAVPNAPTEIPFHNRGVGPNKKSLSPLARLQGIKLLLAALVCMGLLTAVLERRATARKQDEERKRELKDRLEKFKALLPVAKSLALAVDSKEAHRSLEIFKSAVKTTDSATQRGDVEKVETSLAKAVNALQKLQQATLKEADAVMEANKSVSELSLFGLSVEKADEVLVNLGEHAEPVATRPLAKTYHSILKHSKAFPKRLDTLAEKLSSQPLIKNEKDINALLSVAAAFEALRATSASRQRVVELGEHVAEFVFDSIRSKFIGFREHALLDIGGDLQMLKLRYALGKKHPDADKPPSKSEFSLDALKDDITNMENLMIEMRSNIEKLRTCTTVHGASRVNERSHPIEKQARKLLDKWFENEIYLPDCPDTFDEETRSTLMKMGAHNAEIVQKEHDRMAKSVPQMQKILEDTTDLSIEEQDVLSNTVKVGLMEKAKQVARQASLRQEKTAALVKNLKLVEDTRKGLKDLTKSGVNGSYQTVDRGKMDTLINASQLVRLLESDVKQLILLADKFSAGISDLSEAQKDEYKELQEQFDTAKRKAQSAENMVEAADAAANMRDQLLAMEELFLSSNEE